MRNSAFTSFSHKNRAIAKGKANIKRYELIAITMYRQILLLKKSPIKLKRYMTFMTR